MRKFIDFLGREHDLDDPKTYKHLPQNKKGLVDRIHKRVGLSILCMKAWNFQGDQFDRVVRLLDQIAVKDILQKDNDWLKEKLFLLEDETENLFDMVCL